MPSTARQGAIKWRITSNRIHRAFCEVQQPMADVNGSSLFPCRILYKNDNLLQIHLGKNIRPYRIQSYDHVQCEVWAIIPGSQEGRILVCPQKTNQSCS